MEEHKNKDGLEKESKELKEVLDKSDKKSLLYVIKNRRKFALMPNRMCNDCRYLLYAKPSRPESDYCENCRNMMRRILGEKEL